MSQNQIQTPCRIALTACVIFAKQTLLILWRAIGKWFELIFVCLAIVPTLADFLLGICFAPFLIPANNFTCRKLYMYWLDYAYGETFESEERKIRLSKLKNAERIERQQLLDAVTDGLLKSATSKSIDIKAIDTSTCLVFVFTDIENSTLAQVQSPDAYQQAVLKHDITMRECLQMHKGLELDTEGDSFRIVFGETVDAIRFCLDFQETMLETKWPKAILKLPGMKRVVDHATGDLVHCGPRVRMGIHLALPETFNIKVHAITGKPVFSGLSWNIAKNLGDCGAGGQILISDTVWNALEFNLAKAGFPFVEHQGTFILDRLPDIRLDIYQVSKSNGLNAAGMLKRDFQSLRKCTLIGNPRSYDIAHAPQGKVSFVALRASNTTSMLTSFSSLRLSMDLKSSANSEQINNLSDTDSELLLQTVRAVSQQFLGYIFSVENQGVDYLFIAFSKTSNACRFAIALQMSLLCADWQGNPKSEYVGNMLIYRGPTVACAIHNGDSEMEEYLVTKNEADVIGYGGNTLHQLWALVNVTAPGQILLSAKAWNTIQYALGELNQPRVVDVGVHQITNFGTSQLLEILPRELKARSFAEPQSAECLAPGARLAPIASEGVAFLFTYPVKPNTENAAVLQQVEKAIMAFTDLARSLIFSKDEDGKFWGYECQEVGAGSFMLAFSTITLAVKYASILQEQLLTYEWPESVLAVPGFEQVLDDESRLCHRGLRVKMGIGFGYPSYSMPHPNTGRADYFGPVVNLCARTAQVAAEGQILVAMNTKINKSKVGNVLGKNFKLKSVGKHQLKGIKGKVSLAEVLLPNYQHRQVGYVGLDSMDSLGSSIENSALTSIPAFSTEVENKIEVFVDTAANTMGTAANKMGTAANKLFRKG